MVEEFIDTGTKMSTDDKSSHSRADQSSTDGGRANRGFSLKSDQDVDGKKKKIEIQFRQDSINMFSPCSFLLHTTIKL